MFQNKLFRCYAMRTGNARWAAVCIETCDTVVLNAEAGSLQAVERALLEKIAQYIEAVPGVETASVAEAEVWAACGEDEHDKSEEDLLWPWRSKQYLFVVGMTNIPCGDEGELVGNG